MELHQQTADVYAITTGVLFLPILRQRLQQPAPRDDQGQGGVEHGGRGRQGHWIDVSEHGLIRSITTIKPCYVVVLH